MREAPAVAANAATVHKTVNHILESGELPNKQRHSSKKMKSEADQWFEPIPLLSKTPGPIDSEVLPGVLGDFSQALARHTETPTDVTTLAVLGMTSVCLAGKVEVQAEPGYIEPVQLYVCPALESGSRKTAVMDAVRAPIDEFQEEERIRKQPELARARSERKTMIAAVEKLRKNLNVKTPGSYDAEKHRIAEMEADLPEEQFDLTLTTSDTTAEALEELMQQNGGRMAIVSDEGGIFDIMAGRYGKEPNLDVFLKGHTGGRVSTDRRSRKSFIPKASLTFVISPQPSVISGLKAYPFLRERGLLARFLFTVPDSKIGYRKHVPFEIPSTVRLDYGQLMKSLLRFEPDKPIRLTLSKNAYKEWKDFQIHIECMMAQGGSLERLRDWGSKLPGAALRIAGLLTVASTFSSSSGWQPVQIETDSIGRANLLCGGLIDHAAAAFDLINEDPKVTSAKHILRWLAKQPLPEVAKRECFRALQRRFDQVRAMDAPLQVLVEHHYIRLKAARTGGRPSDAIEINPRWRRDAELA